MLARHDFSRTFAVFAKASLATDRKMWIAALTGDGLRNILQQLFNGLLQNCV